MSTKILQQPDGGLPDANGNFQYWFHCPGCECDHAFTVGAGHWTWNGPFDAPSFTPSLLCNRDHLDSRCHSWVTDGRIKFFDDCHHALKNTTVDLPDWKGW